MTVNLLLNVIKKECEYSTVFLEIGLYSIYLRSIKGKKVLPFKEVFGISEIVKTVETNRIIISTKSYV
jgi:hypothetical protein